MQPLFSVSSKVRHHHECQAFREQTAAALRKSYKYSRELLEVKQRVEVLARQKRYDEADRLKRKADKLEQWERMKLDVG